MHWSSFRRLRAYAFAVALWPVFTAAAGAEAQDDLLRRVSRELQLLASHAGTVFVGQISGIERRGSTVEVTFRVEQPVSGAAAATFVLREWAGLWAPGQVRYIVGQRVLAFVHTGSAAGFSTPVHGAEGLVPVEVHGADQPARLNVGRLAASVLRTPSTPLPSPSESTVPLAAALASLFPAARYSNQGAPHLSPTGPVRHPWHGSSPAPAVTSVLEPVPPQTPGVAEYAATEASDAVR